MNDGLKEEFRSRATYFVETTERFVSELENIAKQDGGEKFISIMDQIEQNPDLRLNEDQKSLVREVLENNESLGEAQTGSYAAMAEFFYLCDHFNVSKEEKDGLMQEFGFQERLDATDERLTKLKSSLGLLR